MHLFAGQVDAVGLLERRHDVTGITLVVEGGRLFRAAGGSAGRGFCGLLSGNAKLDEMLIRFHARLSIAQQRLRVPVKPPDGAARQCQRVVSGPAPVDIAQPHHVPKVRVNGPAMPYGGQCVRQQIRHGAPLRSSGRSRPAAAWPPGRPSKRPPRHGHLPDAGPCLRGPRE